jgi:SCY1-like protein 1
VALQDYQRLLASQSVRRLNPAKLSESAALKTKLVDTIAFLESMAVKDSNEKDPFFKRLPATLPSLPLPVVQKKVSPGALLLIIALLSARACCPRANLAWHWPAASTDETSLQLQLLPMLASALEFGGAPSLALGALLQIGKTLDADAFAAQVVPVLSKLFASNDRTIRRSLLESIDTYGTHFTEVEDLRNHGRDKGCRKGWPSW